MDKHNLRYYRKVPAEQVEQLMRFRREHPLKQAVIGRVTWEYLTAGVRSGRPLLFLPGALSTADSAWHNVSLLEGRQHFVVVPSYPAEASSMTGLSDGLAIILRQEGLRETAVAGGSYGGMLAQVLTHRHPELVSQLILSQTYPPVARRASSIDPGLRLFKTLPMFMVKRMLRQRMTGVLPPKPPPELLLIAAQVRETIDTRLTRQAAISTYTRMMDFDQQVFAPEDLANWQGKTLIMMAEDDPTTPEELRKELIALYPGAIVHMFKGTGSLTNILESSESIQVMEDFLNNV
jgi:pimeloyl-ACP methyl ester carboxylesterase